MRPFFCLALLCLGCDPPEIRCIDDNQCLSSQKCYAGKCYSSPPDLSSATADLAPGTQDLAGAPADLPPPDLAPSCSCPAGQFCSAAGACTTCNTNDHCGATCAKCSGGTPYCSAAGTCVQCNDKSQCMPGQCCTANLCGLGVC